MAISSILRSFLSAVVLVPLYMIAQTPLQITVQVNPPYNASYASYFQVPGQVVIMITDFGPSPELKHFYLTGSISTVDGDVSVSMSGRDGWTAPLTISMGSIAISSTDLEPFVQGNTSQVQFTGITETDIRSGLLPEGDYRICLQAFDWFTNLPLSSPEPLGCSNIFTIAYPPAPVVQLPYCEEPVTALMPQLVIFNWILPSGHPPGAIVQYNFRLSRWPEGIDELSALQTNVDLVYETDVMAPVLSYTQAMPPLQIGQRYAWRVKAVDLTGQTVFQNDGYSPPCSFEYIGGNSLFNFAYPLQGDTLPWDFIPIIQRFDPYADYKYFHSQLFVLENGNYHNFISRTIKWWSGAQVTQQALLRSGIPDAGFNLSQEQASHINIYGPLTSVGNKYFHKGKKYDLSANLEISLDYYGSNLIDGSINGFFVGGMGRPRPMLPVHGAEIPKHGGDTTLQGFAPVELRFKTAEPPERLSPPYPIWYIPEGSGTPVQMDGSIDERWVLEVCRDQSFDVPVAYSDGRLGNGMHLPSQTHNCTEECLREQLYKDVTFSFTPADTGTYYWRVKWMLDPNTTAGPSYHEGPIRSFRIIDPAPVAPPPQEPDSVRPAECMAACEFPDIPFEMKVPIDSVKVNDMVHVGLFTMRVTQINWSAMKASGQGTIPVPFLKAPMRVSFQNISINSEMRLYDGEVKGMYDNADVIPPAWIQGGAMFAGFNAQQAETIENFVNSTGRLVSQFTMSNPMGLPIAIDQQTPDGPLLIGVLGMRFTDTLATMNAAMGFPIAEWGFSIGLGNMDIPFRPDGPGCVSQQATLYLVDDIKVNLSSDNDSLFIKATRFAANDFLNVTDSGTFVAWDCKGFRAIQVDGEVRFSKEKLVEDMADGSDGPTKIVGAFKARAGRSGFIARVDMNKPFHVKGGKGWGFDVQEAWLDMASHTNPTGFKFPVQYPSGAHVDSSGNALPTWKGLYIERAMMRLPESITTFDGTGRTTFLVDHLIFDNHAGLSASIKAANLIATDEGSLDGWGYSIDTLQLDIVANSFSQAGFKGRIHLPVTDTLLKYSAMIHQTIATDDWYADFLIQPEKDINAPLWHSTLEIEETSFVTATMGHDQDGTYAQMVLNGKISIDKSMPKIGAIRMKNIHFNHLTFQTRSPYTNADENAVFSFTSPQKWIGGSTLDEYPPDGEENTRKAGGFPVSITKVEVERRNVSGTPMAGLAFDINLNLTGDVNVFTATTRLALLGELNKEAMHKWGHHSLELDSIGVSGDVGVVKVNGGLRFYEGDNVYGDGIKGLLNAEFMKGKLKVKAAMQFGSKDELRYWFADAMLAMENGISVVPGFTVYGFGGGAWYHMKRTSPLPSAQALTNSMIAQQDVEDAPAGLTLSNVTYTPDAATNYGFQATMVFGDPGGGTAYNADVSVGATFSASGGVSTLFLNGNVFFMSKRNERDYVPVRGTAAINFDYPNDVFSANFEVFVEIGSGIITGTGANNKAGNVELLITPDTWHLFAGTPTTPIGLDFIGLFTTESYLMLGKDLPPAADPPANVLAVLPSNYFTRSADVQNASGFAFGSRMAFNQKLEYLLLRFQMGAAAGLDIALVDLGETTCHGMGPGETIGINGWYAKGQVYAYLSGAVSLFVDVWAFEGEIDIFTVAAAAMLQGGLPDPTWMKGSVGGSYSVLHGLVSGSFTFPFEIGAPCEPPGGGLLSGLDPIGDLSPHHNAGITAGSPGVSCAVHPEAILNMKVDTPFDVYEILPNGSRKLHTFRLSIEAFELKEGSNMVGTTTALAGSKDRIMLTPNAFLKEFTTHTVRIKVKAEEKNLTSGAWGPALKNGAPVTWEKIHPFKTGAEPDKLDHTMVDFSYPFRDQRNFLKDECDKGVIQLTQNLGQLAIFNQPTTPNTVRKWRILFTSNVGAGTQEREAQIFPGTPMIIRFDIPELALSHTYSIQLISRDSVVAASGGPFANVMGPLPTSLLTADVSSTTTTSFQGMVNVKKNLFSGYTVRDNEKLLYTYAFRTSMYGDLGSKVASLQYGNTMHMVPPDPNHETLIPSFIGEPFDRVDVIGHKYGPYGSLKHAPLVKTSEARTDHWTTSWTQPVIYNYYQNILSSTQFLTNLRLIRGSTNYVWNGWSWSVTSTPDTIGIPPINTVHFHVNTPMAPLLSASEGAPSSGMWAGAGTAGVSDGTTYANVTLHMRTGSFVYTDYLRMQTITADIMANLGSPYAVESFIPEPVKSNMKTFLGSPYRPLYQGTYQANFHFQVPSTCVVPILYMSTGPTFPPLSGSLGYQHPTGGNPPPPLMNISLNNFYNFMAP